MELWQLMARESIRDLVARYNANGDSGRFEQVIELFAPDASMVLADGERRGHDEIRSIFTSTKERVTAGGDAGMPAHMRHYTATHQIDLLDETTAKGRCYFAVLMPHGLDHWGRYLDDYVVVDGHWRFGRREVLTDGWDPEGWTPANRIDG